MLIWTQYLKITSDADLENKNIEFLEQISVNDESTMETFSSQKKIYNDAIIL